MKILPLFLAFIALEILPTNVLAKMGDAFPGGGGDNIINTLFQFLMLGAVLVMFIQSLFNRKTKKEITPKSTTKRMPTYNGLEVKTLSSGPNRGTKYTVKADGTFNRIVPINAVINRKTKRELELDRMTKIIALQKSERERKKREKERKEKRKNETEKEKREREKNEITVDTLRLLREKRYGKVIKRKKEEGNG